MKKFIALFLAAMLMLCMTACGGSGSGTSGGTGTSTGGGSSTANTDRRPGELYGRKDFDEVIAANDLTLVSVISTWSTPSEEVIPVLQQLSEKYKNVGVIAVVADTVDATTYTRDSAVASDCRAMMENAGATFTVVVPDEYIYTTFCAPTDYFPTSYLVAPDGSIVGSTLIAATDAETFAEFIDAQLAD